MASTRGRVVAGVAVVGLAAGLSGVATPAGAVNSPHSTMVSANPADFTPQIMNGAVMAITQIGNKIVVGGTFTTVRQRLNTADITRNRIFAFDATTGEIDPNFNPNLGGAVNSLDSDGTYVYAGGSFGSVGGNTALRRLARFTEAGTVVAGLPRPNAAVNEVVVRGGRLYVGGAFTSFNPGGVPRGALAAIDTATGALLGELNVPFTGVYDPQIGGGTNVKRFDVSPDGRKLVALGNFDNVGGLTRNQVAVLDLPPTGPATVASWATNRYDAAHNNCAGVFDAFIRDVDISPDGSYFVISTTGGFGGGSRVGAMCDTAARWEMNSTGNEPTWVDYTGGDTSYGVAITGPAVYIGGHFRWWNNPTQSGQAGPGAVPRKGIAALDPLNGLPMRWNPGRARGVGAQGMFATPQGLWVGSDTKNIGGETRQRIALMPLAGGSAVPSIEPASLPNALFLAERSSPGRLMRRTVDGNGAPTAAATVANSALDWSQIRGGFVVNGTLYYGRTDGRFYARTFDGSTGAVGAERAVNMYDDPEDGRRIPFAIQNLTGMFFDPATHRIYYTLSGDRNLYYRYFTPESEVLGAEQYVGNAGSLNLSSVAGMTLASGRVLYGSTDGALRSVAFVGGALSGSATTVSSDGSWASRAMFLPNG